MDLSTSRAWPARWPGSRSRPSSRSRTRSTDDVVVLGYGTDFTKAVLDAAAGGASLAKDARFTDAPHAGRTTDSGLVLGGHRGRPDAVEPLLSAEDKA